MQGREWEYNDVSAMLAACMRSCPIEIDIDPLRDCYRVRNGRGAFIWSDDLPHGGVSGFWQAFLLLFDLDDRAPLRKTLAAGCGQRMVRLAQLETLCGAFRGKRVRVRIVKQEGGILRLSVVYQP